MWCEEVACDSRKQKSYHLNRPLGEHFTMVWTLHSNVTTQPEHLKEIADLRSFEQHVANMDFIVDLSIDFLTF